MQTKLIFVNVSKIATLKTLRPHMTSFSMFEKTNTFYLKKISGSQEYNGSLCFTVH